VLWIYGQDDADVWHFQRFTLPGLEPSPELPLVALPPDDDEVAFVTATDGSTEIALVHAPGSLTAWDGRTGARLGNPVNVPDAVNEATWSRTGHPGQAVVVTEGHIEVWDVPAGQRLGRTALTVQGYTSVIAGPDLLVVRMPDGNLEMRRLPGLEPVGPPIYAPAVGGFLGFDAEGRLVTVSNSAVGSGEIIIWDLERRAEVGRMRPSTTFGSVVGGSLSLQGGTGRLPQVFSLREADWQAHLCRLLPGEPSAGAAALLPAGADRSSPCS
jgi:hypothetical protein